MRLSATLTETETGTVVWSDRLSRTFEALVEGLDALVSRIASTDAQLGIPVAGG